MYELTVTHNKNGDKEMLILTRSIGEKIFINGEEIKICILEVRGSQVRLGIEAPTEISIHREEVFNRIQNGNIQNES